ncbi:MAG: aquaporin [Deltaproteobacteria bacterium]|nr:aquaporin [Deltaproteobacteria bacterium]
MRKQVAEVAGTFVLVFGECGSAIGLTPTLVHLVGTPITNLSAAGALSNLLHED